jgi:outer membrane protein
LKKNLALPTIVLGLAALAAAQSPSPVPTKVGIVNMTGAIFSTKEGQDAQARLQAKFAPLKDKLDKRQADIQTRTDVLRKGAATMSTEAQANLKLEIDKLTTSYNRDMEDAQSDLDQEQTKVTNELGAKVSDILIKYGADNGYAIILDISDQNSPVRYAPTSADVTADIIKLYDQKYPMAAAPAPKPPAAGGAAVPAARPPAAPSAPATKKQ